MTLGNPEAGSADPTATPLRLRTTDELRATCAGHGETWSAFEVRHRQAPTTAAGRRVVEELRDRFCTACPVLLWCARWAREHAYTGLAAGFPYERGERQESTWVARQNLWVVGVRRSPREVPPS